MLKKTVMLKIRYAKNTYGPKCQNTHGPKLWLLDTWAWAHGPGRMGRLDFPVFPLFGVPWAAVMSTQALRCSFFH